MSLRVEDLLPQRGPALLIREVLDLSESEVTCTAEVPVHSPFRHRGCESVSAIVTVEMGAQAAAVLLMNRHQPARRNPRSHLGYIAGVSDVTLHQSTVPAEGRLTIRAWVRLEAAPLFHVEFHALCTDRTVAQGRLVLAIS